jgi:hypothetical protein
MQMRTNFALVATAFALCSASFAAAGSADNEQAYIGRFSGSWTGPATVLKNSMPWQVSCRVNGRAAPDHIDIAGSCNLSIISVPIAADITYDPKSGRYSGTYIGSDVGPARVSGQRQGSVVNLVITWPKVINGDDKARMTIKNDGNGRLSIATFDNVVTGGPEVRTSDASLTLAGPALAGN